MQHKKSKKKPSPAKRPWFTRPGLVATGLALVSLLLYAQTLGYGFVLDDAIVITENVITQRGVAGWGELFSHDTFYGFFQDESKAQLVSGGRYRPLSLALFSLERSLADGPFIHHLFNLIWYAGLTVLLYLFLLTITRHQIGNAPKLPWWVFILPLIVTGVFVVHPLHTEVVTNIKGRDEIMALVGALGASWLDWVAVDRQQWKQSIFAGLVFFLALLSKENAITFLAVIPLLLYAFRRDFKWGQLQYLGPLIGATLVFLIIRQSVIGGGSGNQILELMNNPFVKLEGGRWVPFSFSEWSATVVYGLGKYLSLLVNPVELSHDYYPRAVDIMQWSNAKVLLALLANLVLLGIGFWQLKKRPWLAAGILLYFFTLSIVSNVFFPVGTNLSERFLFMPSLGFALVVGSLLSLRLQSSQRLLVPSQRKEDQSSQPPTKKGKKAPQKRRASFQQDPYTSKLFLGLGLGFMLGFGVLTMLRNPVWESNYTLFTTDVQHQPNSAKLQNAAAGSKIDRYQQLPENQQAGRRGLLTEAVSHLNKALQIHPTYKNAYLLRGNAHFLLQQYDAAISDYDQALALDPGYADAIQNLTLALQKGGRFAGEQQGDLNKSRNLLLRALSLDGNNYETLRLLGVLNGVSGNRNEALKYFKRAADANPQNADALWNLGTAYYQLERIEDANVAFGKARA
ncbi:MAG: tetratricopeptide repeat protein, partial [Bacteroidota bacterium]